MTSINPISINRKLKSLMKNLNALKRYEAVALEDYLDNYEMQLAVERTLQLIIQVSLDVNRYLLKRVHQAKPKRNEVFLASGQYGLLTAELGNSLLEFENLRDELVHLYEDLDPNKIFSAIQAVLAIYPIYVRQITEYIDSLEINYDESN